jgi:hypothetical protein
MVLDTGWEDKFQNWMATSITRNQFPLNFLMKEILIRFFFSKIIKSCHYFKAFISCLYVTIFPAFWWQENNILSRVWLWLIRRGLDWMAEFINTLYIHTVRDYRQYSTVALLHTFQFTIAHALGFSVFTSRILAMDFSQSHCNKNSHMKSSWHNLIPFLPSPLNHLLLPSPEHDAVLSTTVLYSVLLHPVFLLCPLITLGTDPMENTVFCSQECLFTCRLHRNECPSVACVCFAGMCLPSPCLAMGVYFTIFLFCSVFTSRLTSFLASIKLPVFFFMVFLLSRSRRPN